MTLDFESEYTNLIAIFKHLSEFVFKRELMLREKFKMRALILREFNWTKIKSYKELMDLIVLYNKKYMYDIHVKVHYLPLCMITYKVDHQQSNPTHHSHTSSQKVTNFIRRNLFNYNFIIDSLT